MSSDYFSSYSRKTSIGKSFKIGFVIFVMGMLALWYSGNIFYQLSFGYLTGKVGKLLVNLKSDIFSWLSQNSYEDELKALKAKNLKVIQENAWLKEEFSQNKKQLSLEGALTGYNVTEARVIGNDNFFDTPILMIEGGENKGFNKGLAVLDENGVLVGLIKKSEGRFSEIYLLYNHASRVGAKLAGTEWNGVLQGSRNLRGVLAMLPLESDIHEGEEVITDNRNPAIPPNILIGSVAFVRDSEDKLFKEVVLNLFADSKNLTKVWIVTGHK